MNPFGTTQMVYTPIPKKIQLEIVGREKSGKSSLIAKWVRPGAVAVIDSDGRFNDVIPQYTKAEFYPISENKLDMINVDKIVSLMAKAHKSAQGKASAIIVDTLTKILDPIVQDIQDRGSTTVYSYKPKADAMKKLRRAFNEWDAETIWVYHKKVYYKEVKGDRGKEYELAEKNSIGTTEYSRLGADITLSLEIVEDKDGKRGAKVIFARKGRSGFTYWDESGSWENVRENLEQAIWGGLTKEEQDSIYDLRSETLTSREHAIRWGWTFSEENGKFFKDTKHVENSYENLRNILGEEYKASGEKLTAEIMFEAWKQKVFAKEDDLSTPKVKEEEEI